MKQNREENNKYESEQRLAAIGFLMELPNFVCVTAAVFFSRSLIVWMEFIDSLRCILSEALVALMSRKLKRDLRYEYNYGIGKIESISALCVDSLMISGLLVLAFVSVGELMDPKQPSGLLVYVAVLSLLNVIFDYCYYRKEKKLSETAESVLVNSKLAQDLSTVIFDFITMVSLLIAYLFRDVPATWIFSPIAGLGMSVYLMAGCIQRIRMAIASLTDRTLSEDKQMIILKALNSCYEDYDQLISVNSHQSGEVIYIDIAVEFSPGTTYEEIESFIHRVSERITEEIDGAKVSLTLS